MKLENPIVINFKPIQNKDGTTKTIAPLKLNELNYLLIDNIKMKKAMVQIGYVQQPLVLWEKEDYDNIGDYTQVQIESRIIELLGDNPSSVLEKLCESPTLPLPPSRK